MEEGAINDLFEGHAPYRPRYVMPDYMKYIENGSEFLGVKPPKTLDELLSNLQIIYHHVPSSQASGLSGGFGQNGGLIHRWHER